MKKIFDIYNSKMLTSKQIIGKALEKIVTADLSVSYIKANFSGLVSKLESEAHKTFLRVQGECGTDAMEEYLHSKIDKNSNYEDVISSVASCFEEFDRFYLSLSQSRRTRAGGGFEQIIKTLFKRLEYPFQEHQVINGKPDFLMPNRDHFEKNAMDSIIFTVKRTVRERWRQIVTEGARGLGFYLATIDKKISKAQLSEMLRNRIYLVLPESLEKSISHYDQAPNVISFETFFKDHLDPALKRWKLSSFVKGR